MGHVGVYYPASCVRGHRSTHTPLEPLPFIHPHPSDGRLPALLTQNLTTPGETSPGPERWTEPRTATSQHKPDVGCVPEGAARPRRWRWAQAQVKDVNQAFAACVLRESQSPDDECSEQHRLEEGWAGVAGMMSTNPATKLAFLLVDAELHLVNRK